MSEDAVTAVDRGPGLVARRVIVDAEPDELWALLADPHRHHEVDGSGMVRSDVIGPRELRLGDRFRTRMRMGPIPYAMTNTVTACEPGRVIEWRLPAGHRWRWEFEPESAGRTRVTEVYDATGSRVPPVLTLIRAADRNAVGIERSLARLRRRYAPA